MFIVDIHEAKTHLSRLIEQAAKGESFMIAKAGRPLVKVMALDAPAAGQQKRLGFLAGQISVPDDFDAMGSAEIAEIFFLARGLGVRADAACNGDYISADVVLDRLEVMLAEARAGSKGS